MFQECESTSFRRFNGTILLSTGMHLEKNSGLKQPFLTLIEPAELMKGNSSKSKQLQCSRNIDLRDPRVQKVVKFGVNIIPKVFEHICSMLIEHK